VSGLENPYNNDAFQAYYRGGMIFGRVVDNEPGRVIVCNKENCFLSSNQYSKLSILIVAFPPYFNP